MHQQNSKAEDNQLSEQIGESDGAGSQSSMALPVEKAIKPKRKARSVSAKADDAKAPLDSPVDSAADSNVVSPTAGAGSDASNTQEAVADAHANGAAPGLGDEPALSGPVSSLSVDQAVQLVEEIALVAAEYVPAAHAMQSVTAS